MYVALQDISFFPAEVGVGDRSWLPSKNDSRGDSDPKNDPRVFFSVALDYFPRRGADQLPVSYLDDRYWHQRPGGVNLDMLAISPDTYALQRAFRASANLALVANIVQRQHADVANTYRTLAVTVLNRPFLGSAPLRPDLEWAQAIPRQGNLKSTEWRTNHDGFLEMNGFISLLDTVQLLPLTHAQIQQFQLWVRCSFPVCTHV